MVTIRDDVHFADDFNDNQVKGKANLLEKSSAMIGLKIDKKRTEGMKINASVNIKLKVTVDGEPINQVGFVCFVHLGSVDVISKQG